MSPTAPARRDFPTGAALAALHARSKGKTRKPETIAVPFRLVARETA